MSVPPPPRLGPAWSRAAPAAAVLAVAALWPFVLPDPTLHRTGTQLLALVLVGLSLTLTVGWLRVATLFAPASAAGGAAVAAALLARDRPVLALGASAVAGAVAALLALAPATADPRRWLPVTSLLVTAAGVLLVPRYVFRPFAPPDLLGQSLGRDRVLYLAGLVVVAGACLLVARLRRSGAGHRLVGVGAAPAAGATPVRPWIEGVAASGALAGVAGWLTTLLHQGLPSAMEFAPTTAVAYLAIPLVGGPASVGGAVAGAVGFLAAARLSITVGLAAVTLPAALVAVAAASGRFGGAAAWARSIAGSAAPRALLRRLGRR